MNPVTARVLRIFIALWLANLWNTSVSCDFMLYLIHIDIGKPFVYFYQFDTYFPTIFFLIIAFHPRRIWVSSCAVPSIAPDHPPVF